MIKALKEIAELMSSDLYQIDEETFEELLESGAVSMEEDELLNQLEKVINLLEMIKEVKC
tara:strand:+ start:321 stop:500 length:180 start_codon:yes stop_codon:yes gene_type:complete